LTTLLVGVIFVIASVVVLWGFGARERFLAFPVLASFVYLGWVMPQAVFVVDQSALPSDGVLTTLTMAALALFAIILGWWRRAQRRAPAVPTYDPQRLLIGAATLSFAGALFNVWLWSLPDELLRMSQWSGPQTILLFFAKIQWLGMALAWLLWLRHRSPLALGLVLFDLAFLIEPVFLGARRRGMAELALIFLASLWFARQWLPSRAVLVGMAVGGVFVMNAIGAVRAVTVDLVFEDQWPPLREVLTALSEIDYAEATFGEREIASTELALASVLNATVQRDHAYSFGLVYWNALINQYVPGQIVGYQLKSSLQLDLGLDRYKYFSINFTGGQTNTGFFDTYFSFWYFGVVVFFMISRVMRWLYDVASRNVLWAQYIYPFLAVDAMHALTHGTPSFISKMLFYFLVSFIVFWFAHHKPKYAAVFSSP